MKLEDPAPAPTMRKVDELERRRREISAEIERLERDHQNAAAVARVMPAQVARLLKGRTEELLTDDPAWPRAVLASPIDRVTLAPHSLECSIHYRLQSAGGEWQSMASPTGFDNGNDNPLNKP